MDNSTHQAEDGWVTDPNTLRIIVELGEIRVGDEVRWGYTPDNDEIHGRYGVVTGINSSENSQYPHEVKLLDSSTTVSSNFQHFMAWRRPLKKETK